MYISASQGVATRTYTVFFFSFSLNNSALQLAVVIGPAGGIVSLIVLVTIITIIVIVMRKRYKGQVAVLLLSLKHTRTFIHELVGLSHVL